MHRFNFLQDCRDIALDVVVDIIQKLNDNQKAEVIKILSSLGNNKEANN